MEKKRKEKRKNFKNETNREKWGRELQEMACFQIGRTGLGLRGTLPERSQVRPASQMGRGNPML